MAYTQHAQIRAQQRGIPPILIDLLLRFGAHEKAGDGTQTYFFDKTARRQVRSYAGLLAVRMVLPASFDSKTYVFAPAAVTRTASLGTSVSRRKACVFPVGHTKPAIFPCVSLTRSMFFNFPCSHRVASLQQYSGMSINLTIHGL